MPPSLNSVRKTVTSFGKNANAYAQAEAPGTIDQSVDVLRNKYHQPVLVEEVIGGGPYGE
jgi:hypothetical protein